MEKMNLKAIRANYNMSQEEFAEFLDIERRRYQDLENGKRKLLAKELLIISEKCNIPPSKVEC